MERKAGRITMVAKKKSTKKTTSVKDTELRTLVAKSMNKQLGGSKATKSDIDDAMKFIKPRIKKHLDIYAFSPFSAVDIAVHEYLESLFE